MVKSPTQHHKHSLSSSFQLKNQHLDLEILPKTHTATHLALCLKPAVETLGKLMLCWTFSTKSVLKSQSHVIHRPMLRRHGVGLCDITKGEVHKVK